MIYMALTEHLAMLKVCAHWAPLQLTEDNRTLRMGWVLEFLTQYHMKGNELIKRIVTGDELWIHFWMPETKAQSKVWKKKIKGHPKEIQDNSFNGQSCLQSFGIVAILFIGNLGMMAKG